MSTINRKHGNSLEATYKSYVAVMVSVGASPLSVTIMDNSVGNIVWARTSAGVFTGTLSGAFTANKTFLRATINDSGTNTYPQLARTSANVITLTNTDTVSSLDDFSVSIEIIVGL